MKKKKLLIGLTTLGVATILLTGCSKLPQVEIDAAQAAIDEAKTAGADVYVHESFVSLEDSMKSVMAGVETQKSKFFKNYSASKEGLTGVAQYAQEVKQQTETRKVELKSEIQTTIEEVKSLITANKALIAEAPKGKEGTTALVAITGELTTIETAVNEAGGLLEKGEYLPTLDKVKAAKAKATSINTELQEVIAKYKVNVKNRKS